MTRTRTAVATLLLLLIASLAWGWDLTRDNRKLRSENERQAARLQETGLQAKVPAPELPHSVSFREDCGKTGQTSGRWRYRVFCNAEGDLRPWPLQDDAFVGLCHAPERDDQPEQVAILTEPLTHTNNAMVTLIDPGKHLLVAGNDAAGLPLVPWHELGDAPHARRGLDAVHQWGSHAC